MPKVDGRSDRAEPMDTPDTEIRTYRPREPGQTISQHHYRDRHLAVRPTVGEIASARATTGKQDNIVWISTEPPTVEYRPSVTPTVWIIGLGRRGRLGRGRADAAPSIAESLHLTFGVTLGSAAGRRGWSSEQGSLAMPQPIEGPNLWRRSPSRGRMQAGEGRHPLAAAHHDVSGPSGQQPPTTGEATEMVGPKPAVSQQPGLAPGWTPLNNVDSGAVE